MRISWAYPLHNTPSTAAILMTAAGLLLHTMKSTYRPKQFNFLFLFQEMVGKSMHAGGKITNTSYNYRCSKNTYPVLLIHDGMSTMAEESES